MTNVQRNISHEAVRKHFDRIASHYDDFKEKNSYYYAKLKELYGELMEVPGCGSVIELGCGSGCILEYLNPKLGIGVDVSQRMIENATRKYEQRSNLNFYCGSIDDIAFMNDIFKKAQFDYCIIPDTLEHLVDLPQTFHVLSQIVQRSTMVIMSWGNPIWTPVLEMLEVMRLKMPEGPHRWPGMGEVSAVLNKSGFIIVRSGRRILIPVHIPVISEFVNERVFRVPLLRRLCLLQFVVCRRATGGA